MSYQALFAVFAGVYVGFTLAGLWLAANPAVWAALIDLVNGFIPGLLQQPGQQEEALVDPDALIQPLALASRHHRPGRARRDLDRLDRRDPHRRARDLPAAERHHLLPAADAARPRHGPRARPRPRRRGGAQCARHLRPGLLAGELGASTSSTAFVLTSQAVATLLVFVLDTLTLVALFRVVSGIRVPGGILWRGALLGGAAMTVLQLLGGSLLGGVAANPLFASFTALIGVLIWFNLMNQLLLLIAAWIATGAEDSRCRNH